MAIETDPHPPIPPPPHLGPTPPPHGPKPPHPGPRPPFHGPKPPPPDPKHSSIWFRHDKHKPLKEDSIFYKIPVLFVILVIEVIVSVVFTLIGNKELTVVTVFIITMIVILSRLGELNEAYPAAIGAVMVLLTGVVSNENLVKIIHQIGGASITIIATLVMAIVLESFGFFHWVASRLALLSKGSGYRLFFYTQLLCFLMTLLFNNDGSILITTPILILLLRNLKLHPHEQIPYLLSGALIATSSSAPIGVSNIVNLISLNMVHLTLYSYTKMMFVPGIIGLSFMSILMFFVLKRRIPLALEAPSEDLEDSFFSKFLKPSKNKALDSKQTRARFMLKILGYVLGIRAMIFVASYLNIPIEVVAIAGSVILLLARWSYLRTGFMDVLKKAPWHILIFALSMYIIIYGLHNIGLTDMLASIIKPMISQNLFTGNFVMGGLTAALSNTFNNHPALMVSTIVLQDMNLDINTLKSIYLANIIGSDIGSLLLPIGTLASLLWMFILRKNKIHMSWREYVKVTVIVIPLTVIFTLFILYYWVQMVYIG